MAAIVDPSPQLLWPAVTDTLHMTAVIDGTLV